ncbi:transcriptional regulator FeaR [Pseudomonas ovata]|uniref:transcriptional regulator FeaR n=1 Tax=Pseudomonas ovata TaxID=1839709 RepID=UPI000D69825A|nr:transcriptional regulator FeaR [Pseudomonas ovata]
MNHALQHEQLFLGREGFEVWHGSLASSCGIFHVEPPCHSDITTFQGAVTAVDSESCALQGARITSNCSQVYRRASDIRRDDQDFFYLVMQLGGEAVICQSETQTRLQRGDLVLLDVARPSDFHFQGLSDQVSFILPRDELLQRFKTRHVRLNQRIEATSSIGAMSAMLVNQLMNNTTLARQESLAVLEAILALLRPALATDDSSEPADSPALLVKARTLIERHLDDEGLCPEQIASAIGTSVRSLHRLFTRSGMSVGRYILERRLQRCAQAIAHSDLKISHIAIRWGFKDLGHFSRAFRNAYGMSPSDYRHSVLQTAMAAV